MITRQLVPFQSPSNPVRRQLVRQQTQIERAATLSALASQELHMMTWWAAYLGTQRLAILEHHAKAADLAGRMSAQRWEAFFRHIEEHQAALIEMVDQAGLTMAGILSS